MGCNSLMTLYNWIWRSIYGKHTAAILICYMPFVTWWQVPHIIQFAGTSSTVALQVYWKLTFNLMKHSSNPLLLIVEITFLLVTDNLSYNNITRDLSSGWFIMKCSNWDNLSQSKNKKQTRSKSLNKNQKVLIKPLSLKAFSHQDLQ